MGIEVCDHLSVIIDCSWLNFQHGSYMTLRELKLYSLIDMKMNLKEAINILIESG